jgi:hypothetical protein
LLRETSSTVRAVAETESNDKSRLADVSASNAHSTAVSSATLAGQYKQTQMKSSIFGIDEPAGSGRMTSDKNKSNIFGIGDHDDQNKNQTGFRQGRRGT